MGSDVMGENSYLILLRILNFLFWNKVIVKTSEMKRKARLRNADIIPNGVNFKKFTPRIKKECQNKLGWNDNEYHILFAADPNRKEKNYKLVENALKLLKIPNIRIHHLGKVDHDKIVIWMNACDVLLLTSFYEGSPNVIKEAMACCIPIVTTDVGDVREIISDTEGCYICTYQPTDVAEKIRKAIAFNSKTKGRQNIKHLDSTTIAEKIITLYQQLIRNSKTKLS